jgi:hypothetical protein
MVGCTKFKYKIDFLKDHLNGGFFILGKKFRNDDIFFPFSNLNTYLCRPKINGQ